VVELQWGHGIRAVESRDCVMKLTDVVELQWGHGIRAVESKHI